MKRGWIVLFAMTAWGCQGQIVPAPQQKESRLLQGCGETERLLGEFGAGVSSFRYDRAGNATISKSRWEEMPPSLQDGLIKVIAYQAFCASREPGDQQVIVRSSETSEILAQQTVTEFNR